VLEANSFDAYRVIAANLLEPWPAPEAAAFPAGLKDPQGVWTANKLGIDIVAWNTNLVPRGEEPRSYDDLTDPRWRGKLLLEKQDVEMFAALVHGKFGGSLDRATEWLQKIAANEPQVHSGHTATTELLVAGQGAVFLGALGDRVENLKSRGAPVDWMQTEGTQMLAVTGLVKGGPYSNAAKLFIDWGLSAEGQQARGTVEAPARPGTPMEVPLLPAGMTWYPSRPELAKDYNEYQRIWNTTLRIG
jgi:iron(III) transport system substrate-binding protein